jgi:hypothetical protein
MTSSRAIVLALVAATGTFGLQAEQSLPSINGTCHIAASERAGTVELRLRHGTCSEGKDCGTNQTDEPASAFSGFALADLGREGAHIDAVLGAEAGKLSCEGTVHNGALAGDAIFVPDPAFVGRMEQMGFTGLDSPKLEAYTLFRIEASWIKELRDAGVRGMTADNIIALHIFKVDVGYIHSMSDLGYSQLDADQLIAERVQGVNPEEVKRVQAMGYHPSQDELVQMRIFHVTPDFIQRMQAKGLHDLTISKLVQIRIFKLAE